jgi:hypothetical protein
MYIQSSTLIIKNRKYKTLSDKCNIPQKCTLILCYILSNGIESIRNKRELERE